MSSEKLNKNEIFRHSDFESAKNCAVEHSFHNRKILCDAPDELRR